MKLTKSNLYLQSSWNIIRKSNVSTFSEQQVNNYTQIYGFTNDEHTTWMQNMVDERNSCSLEWWDSCERTIRLVDGFYSFAFANLTVKYGVNQWWKASERSLSPSPQMRMSIWCAVSVAWLANMTTSWMSSRATNTFEYKWRVGAILLESHRHVSCAHRIFPFSAAHQSWTHFSQQQ